MHAHHNAPSGERHYRAKLTESKVREARRRAAAGEPIRKLAREYGVADTVMGKAVRGVTWRAVK